MAAALSAAIFAVYQIYIPAMNMLREMAKNNTRVANKAADYLDAKSIRHIVFFVMAFVLFPIFILPLLFENFRVGFVENFVKGILADE